MPTVPSYKHFTPSSPLASRIKRANRRAGGRAEQLLGSSLWNGGLRYRKHHADLPGKPDFVFCYARLCVFVDGDFWHGRNWPMLRERLLRRANATYWVAKIERNIQRDREQDEHLAATNWQVLRFWETDVLADPLAATRIVSAVLARSSGCRG